MSKTTPATVALTKAGVAFSLFPYDYDPDAPRVGLQAAEALGVPNPVSYYTVELLPVDQQARLRVDALRAAGHPVR